MQLFRDFFWFFIPAEFLCNKMTRKTFYNSGNLLTVSNIALRLFADENLRLKPIVLTMNISDKLQPGLYYPCPSYQQKMFLRDCAEIT
jgi:hypothetical protein